MMTIENTIHDGSGASIYAKELKIYVQHPKADTSEKLPVLPWTGTKVALIELIYALQTAGVFNQATADIKQVAAFFQQVFGVELGNIYNVFKEMRMRKKNRTHFIDLLKDRLIQRMDEADELT